MYISSFMQARFIRIHTGLYLYPCYLILTSIVKNDSSFTAQTDVIMITVVKNKRKKKGKEEKYIGSERFEPVTLSSRPQALPTGYEGFLEQMM